MLCKACQTESPNEYCSYLCTLHGACLDKLENGTPDERELAQHAIQRHEILGLYPEVLPAMEARYNALQNERYLLLDEEWVLKAAGNKARLKMVTADKKEVNSKLEANLTMRQIMNSWKHYRMFAVHSDQCAAFRRWRLSFAGSRQLLDPVHEEALVEMMELVAPR